jgi:hypothetical protein
MKWGLKRGTYDECVLALKCDVLFTHISVTSTIAC